MDPAAYILDPRDLPDAEPLPYRVIWLDPRDGLFCMVDEIDYEWALRWTWSVTPNSRGKKFYATRSTRLFGRDGPQTKLYMHKEILKRSGLLPPSERHTIGDHLDGNSLNNRRSNLRWATLAENNRNRMRV